MKRLSLLVLLLASPAWAEVRFVVGDVYGVPGETVEFDVEMETDGEAVSSASLTLSIDRAAGAIPANPTDGHPFCWIDYRTTVTSVRFRESGVLISVLGPENGLHPPREFARCRFSIEPHYSSGEYALAISLAGWSDPLGFEHDAARVNGSLFVLSEEMPSPTRTPTQTATRTKTAAPTDTATPSATPTGTPTPIPVSMPDVIASVFDPLPPLVADVNGDNRVNVADLIEYVRHYGLD